MGQSEVLDVLNRYPLKSFSNEDLSRILKVRRNNVGMATKKLYKAGFINLVKKGDDKHFKKYFYQVNKEVL